MDAWQEAQAALKNKLAIKRIHSYVYVKEKRKEVYEFHSILEYMVANFYCPLSYKNYLFLEE